LQHYLEAQANKPCYTVQTTKGDCQSEVIEEGAPLPCRQLVCFPVAKHGAVCIGAL